METSKEESDSKAAAALVHAGSEIEGLSGTIGRDFYVWSTQGSAVKKNPDVLFALCQVMPGSTPQKLVLKQIRPDVEETTFEASPQKCWNATPEVDVLTYGDIGSLPHANVPSVLDYLQGRFLRDCVYSTAEPLVVAVNPFKDLHNTGPDVIAQYREEAEVENLKPHIFYAAKRSMQNMHQLQRSQTIIVSGESGAGKTETTKQLMRFLASSRSGNLELKIQAAIMAANPVLEAFGNAKTVRNNNSSRFGRFVQLAVAKEGGIFHGKVDSFLLEKSRVVFQAEQERSYHIFYQLLKGAPLFMRHKYGLQPLESYAFLNPKCYSAPGIDDEENFEQVVKSFESMDLSEAEICTIWSVVSGVLQLGNAKSVAIKEGGIDDAAEYVGAGQEALKRACNLLFLDYEKVYHELTVKTTFAGSNKILGRWDAQTSDILRCSLAKGVYEKLFSWLIKKLNQKIEPKGGFSLFIGLLDIFGFEVFQNNSLEQLFINITNEMIQRTFTDLVFTKEAQLYKSEGIQVKSIAYTTNDALVDTLAGKGTSVLSALEDQCIAPSGNDEKFVSSLMSLVKDKPGFVPSKITKGLLFTIQHTIGKITYNADRFCFKNKDVLRAEIVEIVQESNNEVMRNLFEGVKIEKGKMSKGSLIGSQFLAQLTSLMTLTRSTESHFIRCIKPNDDKLPMKWVNSKVLIQLHALSVLEALQLRQLAFSYRRTFAEFIAQFRFLSLALTNQKNISLNQLCQELITSAKVPTGDFALGKTMIFLKPQAAKHLVRLQREALASWEPIVTAIECITSLNKMKKIAEERVVPATRICSNIRRKLVQATAAEKAQA